MAGRPLIFSILDIHCNKLSRQPTKRNKPILKDKDVIDELNNLKSKYILVPVDKASKNTAIICKSSILKFYYLKLDGGKIQIIRMNLLRMTEIEY